jgi:hypothetical protein
MAAAGGPDGWVQVLSKIGSKKNRKTNIGVLCIFLVVIMEGKKQ